MERLDIKWTMDPENLRDKVSRSLVMSVLKKVAQVLQSEMVKEAPVDQGKLRGSIQPPIQIGDDAYGIVIGANYWRYIQFGTRPHTIEAKGPKPDYPIFPKTPGGVLHFVKDGKHVFVRYVKEHPNPGYLAFKVGGRTIFRHSVRHPGTKANPFVDRAITNTEARIDGLVQQVLTEVGL